MRKYCLDTNCFIEPWNKHYSPDFCKGYWDVLDQLARNEIIFINGKVEEEIIKKDDELAKWIKERPFLVKPITQQVQIKLKEIYAKDKRHLRLVDNTKDRSMADPWVIAHAIVEKAVVVTKEPKMDPPSTKIKIPNVCDNMGIEWIDEFDFIRETNILFDCRT